MMKAKTAVAAFAASVLAFAAMEAVAERAITYHGKLVPVGNRQISTKVPMPMEFRLYRSETPGETSPLWGRRVPVRFDEKGMFYVELCDGAGAQVDRAEKSKLADAIAAAEGSDLWISVTPVGYGELLPRKKLGGVHRAEYAACARKTKKLAAPALKATVVNAEALSVTGAFKVTKTFTPGGGTINNVLDGKKDVTIGSSSGSVLFSDDFDNWRTFTGLSCKDGAHVSIDTLSAVPGSSAYGVFSIPLPAGSYIQMPNAHPFKSSSFVAGNYNPFF